MRLTRRAALAGMGALPTLTRPALAADAVSIPVLPDLSNFRLAGTYLDAAFTHPFGQMSYSAAADYLTARKGDPQSVSPRRNDRDLAVQRFAALINAAPADIAVVPSTLEAENLVNESLATGPGAGVVTDSGHYDGSLALYGEMQRQGVPVAIVPSHQGRIDLAEVRSKLTSNIRLLAISLVSSSTGFSYDLSELCSLAHSRNVLVYADLVQAAGAVPIDVQASGVDFAGCGTYKWLMGDFGTAFLYVRPDRLARLKRVQVGWRPLRNYRGHTLPFESAGPALGSYELATNTAGIFEVSTPAWGALAVVSASLAYLASIGVQRIAQHRRPLLERLRSRLPADVFLPLTPADSNSPVLSFACQNARIRFGRRLEDERVKISLYEDRIRISPSVYNTADHIDHLLDILLH